jgi:hypothetical protein
MRASIESAVAGLARRGRLRPLALAVVLACGCGQGRGTYAEVSGTVTLDEAPLGGVIVEFYPVVAHGEKAKPFSRAVTDGSGRYQLTCENRRPGALVGEHRVVVRPPPKRNPDGPPQPPPGPPIPLAYRVASETPLRVEVKADQSVYDLPLRSH